MHASVESGRLDYETVEEFRSVIRVTMDVFVEEVHTQMGLTARVGTWLV
jgi:hypothetical protein